MKRILFTLSACLITTIACFSQETLQTVTDRGSSTTNNISITGTGTNYINGRTTADSAWTFKNSVSINSALLGAIGAPALFSSWTWYKPYISGITPSMMVIRKGQTDVNSYLKDGLLLVDTLKWISNVNTAGFNQLQLSPVLNLNGFSGITRGIYVNPVLNNITNFRAIETNNNTGTGYQLYAGGTAPSAFKGRVSIGKDTARSILDVGQYISNGALGTVLARLYEGDTRADGTFLGVRAWGTQPNEYSGKSFSIEHSFYGALNSAINFYRGDSDKGGYITFATADGTEKMRINQNGYVGIGTANPQSALAVKGTITSTSVKVTRTGWADYVFDSSYQLPSLSHVETFIKQNKHLPEVPSAAEVKKEGLDLGDNQAVLLKKIEELTLYIIHQNKKVEQMEKRLQELETIH